LKASGASGVICGPEGNAMGAGAAIGTGVATRGSAHVTPVRGSSDMHRLAVLPLVSVVLIADVGLRGLFLVLAGLHLLLLPLLLGVSDRPASACQPHAGLHAAAPPDMLSARKLLRLATFWMMCVGGGYLNSAGVIAISHLVPFAAERGIPVEHAALLLSIMGGSAVIGSLIVGFLCGRIGAALTLALIAATQAVGWFVLFSTSAFPLMAMMTLVLGVGGAGVFPAINVLAGRLFGIASLPRVVGLFGLVTLPFTFGLPPLAGVLRDASGNYSSVVIVIIACSSTTAVMFLALAKLGARRQAQIARAA